MKKYLIVNLVILTVIFLSSCAKDGESKDFQIASLSDIDTNYIDYGSTKVNVVSEDINELEATLLLYDNGPGIINYHLINLKP